MSRPEQSPHRGRAALAQRGPAGEQETAHAAPGAPATAEEAQVAARRARMLQTLLASQRPFLIGGAYGFHALTGIARFTKDFDVFIKPGDRAVVLRTLERAGYRVEVPFPHWLSKASDGDVFLDVIHGAGNGIASVDEGWFRYAITGEVFGVRARFCPAEETIWSKAFIMERERFDGADVLHILHARAEQLDWARLVRRFGAHWRVLLAHLVLFGFVFPGERTRIPAGVLASLQTRLAAETQTPAPGERICQGTLISREQYLVDVECRGYRDVREATLTSADIAGWTAAIPGRGGNVAGDRAEGDGETARRR